MIKSKAYYVNYKMYSADTIKGIYVLAKNKEEAYDIAVYEKIPMVENESPYSAWVASVTYNNGNYKAFNTFEGMPY